MAPIDINNQEINSITLNGNTEIDTVEVNGQTVFSAFPSEGILVEGFERTSPLDIYSGNTGAFEASTSEAFEGNKSLRSTGGPITGGFFISSTTGLSQYPEPGQKFSYRIYYTSAGSGRFYFAVQSEGSTATGYQANMRTNGSELRLRRLDNGDATSLGSTSVSVSTDEWLEVEIEWGNDGTIIVTGKNESGSVLGSISATDNTYSSGGIGWGEFINAARWFADDVRIIENL